MRFGDAGGMVGFKREASFVFRIEFVIKIGAFIPSPPPKFRQT